MLKKTIGIVIFLVAVVSQIGMEDILNFFDKQILAFIAAASLGLFIANYRKGMERTFLLKKMKKYILFSGILAAMVQLAGFTCSGSQEQTNVIIFRVVIPVFWSYLISTMVDIFIIED